MIGAVDVRDDELNEVVNDRTVRGSFCSFDVRLAAAIRGRRGTAQLVVEISLAVGFCDYTQMFES